MTARKPASQADIGEAIGKHVDAMHTDFNQKLKSLESSVESLSQDINATSKCVVENGKQVADMASTMQQFIDAKNGIGLIGDGIIYVGRIVLAISVIGAAIWGALHFGGQK